MVYERQQPVAAASALDEAPVQRIESSTPVALWQTRFKVYEEGDTAQGHDPDTCDSEGEAPKEQPHKRNFAIGHEPIAGAFVVCVPVSDPLATQSITPSYENALFGRTNDVGWIVRRSRSQLGGEADVPRSPWEPAGSIPGWPLRSKPSPVFKLASPARDRTTFYAPSGSTWRIFWTFAADHFSRFCLDLQKDCAAALREWNVPEYTISPAPPPRDQPALRLLPKGSLRARYVDYFLLRGNERRFLNAFKKLERGRGRGSAADTGEKTVTAAILNATPASFWALYYAEFLSWYTERAIQDDGHWPYLWRLWSVIQAAESHAPFPDLEKALPSGGPVGDAAHAMQRYLYQLAKAGIRSRGQVRTLVEHITVSHDGWRSTANGIFQSTFVRHPALDDPNLDKFNFDSATVGALIAYFDMYVLGFDRAADALPLRSHWEHVQKSIGWVRSKQAQLIEGIPHGQLLRDIDLCLPRSQREARIALAQRFQEQCACLGIAFWEEAEATLQQADEWKKLQPFLAWLGEGTDLVALLFEKLLAHYIAVYQLRARSVEALVQHLFRFHTNLREGAVERTLPKARAVVRVSYDPGKGRAVAELWRGAKKQLLGEFELLTEVKLPEGLPPWPTDTRSGRKGLRRALKAMGTRTFVLAEQALEVPNAELLEGFGKQLAEAGALLRVSIALTSLVQELKNNPPEAVSLDTYLAVAEETFQALGPTSSLAEYILRKQGGTAGAAGHAFVRGASRLVALGDVIEGARNIASGGQTVASILDPHRSTNNLGMYLSRGETTAVWLEGAKGLVQVATGSAGLLGSLVLGMGTTVAALPLSTWVMLGSVAIATADAVVYVASGGDSPVDAFLRKVIESRADEFQLTADGDIRLPDETRPEPHHHNQIKPSSALSKHLGGLHALVLAHLGGVAQG